MKKLLVLLIVISNFYNLSSQNVEGAHKLIEEGIKLHDRQEYNEAIEKYNEALKLDKDNLFALAEKAMTLHSIKKYTESIECCKLAMEKYPDNPELITVYVTYGNSLDLINKTDQSIELYEQGIKKFPKYYQLHFNKGISLSSVERYDEAIQSFESALKLQPKHPGSHNGLARSFELQHQKIPAILAYCAYLGLAPDGIFAKQNIKYLENLLNSFIKVESSQKTTINISASNLKDSLDNFSTTEMMFAFTTVLPNIEKADSNKNKLQVFTKTIENFCKSLGLDSKNEKGFCKEFYVPYFKELKKQNFIEPFACLIQYSSKDPLVLEWLQKNQETVKKFIEWNSKYKWNDN